MLKSAPGLMAVAVLEELQRRYPQRFDGTVLRTLQRRVRQRRAEHGGEREIFFAQVRPPGRLDSHSPPDKSLASFDFDAVTTISRHTSRRWPRPMAGSHRATTYSRSARQAWARRT